MPRDATPGRDASAMRDAATPDASPPPSPGEWTPPLGIPEPEFGIRELAPNAPDPWTTDTPGLYYVDNTHAAATDDANPHGTPDKPRLSVPVALEAGDVVQLRGGPYVGDLSFRGVGRADAPIFVSGPADGVVVIDGHVDVEGSYLLLERLTLDGDDAGLSVRTPSDHIAVRFCEVRNAVGRGTGLYTGRWNPEDDPAVATQVVFYGNTLHDLGDWHATVDEDHHAVALGHHADHVWIVDNQMFHVSGDGVQVNAKRPTSPRLCTTSTSGEMKPGRTSRRASGPSRRWTS